MLGRVPISGRLAPPGPVTTPPGSFMRQGRPVMPGPATVTPTKGATNKVTGWVGYPYESSGEGAGDLEVQPGGVVLARVQALGVFAVPAGHEGAVHDQGLVQVVCGGYEVCEDLDDTGRPLGDGSAGRGLAGSEGLGLFGLGAVGSLVGQGCSDFFYLAQCWWLAGGLWGAGVIVDEGLVADCDCFGGQACCMVHARTCSENNCCVR